MSAQRQKQICRKQRGPTSCGQRARPPAPAQHSEPSTLPHRLSKPSGGRSDGCGATGRAGCSHLPHLPGGECRGQTPAPHSHSWRIETARTNAARYQQRTPTLRYINGFSPQGLTAAVQSQPPHSCLAIQQATVQNPAPHLAVKEASGYTFSNQTYHIYTS